MEVDTEQRLWKAVLITAMEDKDDTYLRLDNTDFLEVCDLAGVSPHKVVEQYKLGGSV